MNKPKILIVDDEPDIVEMLSYNLEKEGFEIYTAYDGLTAIQKAEKYSPDLIILDIMMPKIDGIQVCQILREKPEFAIGKTIIIFLTARSEDYSHIAGLEVGADDYITKPIRPKVLLTRINTLLKRFNIIKEKEREKIEFDDLVIDPEEHIVYVSGEKIKLPRKEFDLLLMLASKPNHVFTRETIYNRVWGSKSIVGDRTIDVHIRKLREKIGEKYIETIKGVGYKFIA